MQVNILAVSVMFALRLQAADTVFEWLFQTHLSQTIMKRGYACDEA